MDPLVDSRSQRERGVRIRSAHQVLVPFVNASGRNEAVSFGAGFSSALAITPKSPSKTGKRGGGKSGGQGRCVPCW